VLAEEGIHKAINDYRVKHGMEPWLETAPHAHEHSDDEHGDELTCGH
jgi:nitrogen fixation NifU-like protein